MAITQKKAKILEYLLNFAHEKSLKQYLSDKEQGTKTKLEFIHFKGKKIPRLTNEYWTSKQRQASSIHEVSYRACFKPQLPRFFIKLLSEEKDIVYDPFSGRGTTVIEAGLLNRNIIANDINPLSKILTQSRFFVPTISQIEERLSEITFDYELSADIDLSMFYHKKTEAEIVSLKNYLLLKEKENTLDYIDNWIRMVATNRLTGHSKGFFSVYTLPPNQATSPERQIKINQKRNQIPDYRNVKKLIVKKSKSLIRNLSGEDINRLKKVGKKGLFLTKEASQTSEIRSESVQLVITSPPFLNVVQYAKDNWLRCWFNGIDAKEIEKKITVVRKIDEWTKIMGEAFKEFYRVVKSDGWIAFEVGEVKGGKIRLDEHVVPLGIDAGFECEGIVINLQEFTKTSNIWGVNNNQKGTNTNRIVLLHKI